MAYGARKNIGWVQCWTNGKYAVDVYVYYYQDPIANKTKLVADNQRLRSLTQSHSLYNYTGVNNGWGWQTHGGTVVDVNDPVSVSAGGTWTRGNANSCQVERAHNPNGTPQTTYLSCQFIAMINQYSSPEFDWINVDITSKIPSISRSGGTISVSETAKTINSISYNITSTMYTTLIQYSLDGSNWYDTGVDIPISGGGTVAFKLNGLSPNKAYSVRFRFRRDHNQVWSNTVTVNTTTPKPSAPTMGTLRIDSYTPTTITVGFSKYGGFGTGATWGYYQWKLSTESNWRNVNNSNPYKFTGLSPNKSYTIQCRLMDNYGSVSSTVSISQATPKPPAPTVGQVTVSNITPFTAKATWSGFKADASASISKYFWSVDTKTWNNVGNVTSATITGLNEETTYTVYIVAEDNFGTQSSRATAQFTTLVDQLKIKVNVGGVVKVGKVFVNVNGVPKKVKKAFVNVNGQARTVLKG